MPTGSAILPEAILVALDFLPGSRRAFDVALTWRPPNGEITVLHVIDTEFATRVHVGGLGSVAESVAKMRARADEEMAWLAQDKGSDAFAPMVVEGVPFVEILKIARDLEVDLIVMGTHGGATRLDELLFGSTAEKVLRASPCPVLCVP